MDVSIYDLSWFGSSRKQDPAVVATLFGIMGRALCRKNADCRFSEFKTIRQGLNFLQIENMPGSNNFPAVLPETPSSAPAEIGHNISNAVAISLEKTTSEALQEVEKITGHQLKSKRAGKFAKDCLEALREKVSSGHLGKVLGHGLLYSGQRKNEEFVRETVSSALLTVAEKQGNRRAFTSLLKENISDEYFSAIGVPGWIQLYEKLATKLPNRSWHGKPF